MIKQLNHRQLFLLVAEVKKEYGVSPLEPVTVKKIHDAYVEFRNQDLVPDLSESTVTSSAVFIGNRLNPESPQFKNLCNMVLKSLLKLVKSSKIEPEVMISGASIIQDQAKKTAVVNVVDSISDVFTESVNPIAEKIPDLKKYFLIGGAVVILGGGLYAYTLYTVNKKLI